jgi:salicylate hydroxylase
LLTKILQLYRGAVQAIEDAAALHIIFGKDFGYTQDVAAGLKLYEKIRKPRATRVQAASIRATEDINERIGFSSTPYSQGKHADTGVLTIDEMNLVRAVPSPVARYESC